MRHNIFPAALAVGAGIFTGYYTFQPSLEQLQSAKADKAQQDRVSAENAHTDPAALPVTTQDPAAPPRQTWSEWIWRSKKSTDAAGRDAPATGDNRGDNQR